MTNFKINTDGECSGIEPTDEEVDNFFVFPNLRMAKRALLETLDAQAFGIRECMKEIRKMRVGDFK